MLFVRLTISKSSGQFFSLAVCFVSQAVSSDIPSFPRVEDNYGDKRWYRQTQGLVSGEAI